MAMTVDGHVAHPSAAWNFGSSEDRRRMDRLREWADCLIVSRKTLEHDNMDLRVRSKPGGKHPRPVIVMQSARPFKSGLRVTQYAGPSGELWLAPGHSGITRGMLWNDLQADWEIRHFDGVEKIVASLAERGFRKILLEGGPTLNGKFFEHNLVDEFYLTLLPLAWGGTTTDRSIITAAPLPLTRFTLRSAEKRRDEMFLRYVRKQAQSGRQLTPGV